MSVDLILDDRRPADVARHGGVVFDVALKHIRLDAIYRLLAVEVSGGDLDDVARDGHAAARILEKARHVRAFGDQAAADYADIDLAVRSDAAYRHVAVSERAAPAHQRGGECTGEKRPSVTRNLIEHDVFLSV